MSEKGSLLIIKSKYSCKYYRSISENGVRKRIYIKNKDSKIAERLAQKSYNKRVLKIVDRRLKQIQKFNKEFYEDEIEQVYESLSEERKALVFQVVETYKDKLNEWLKIDYVPLQIYNSYNHIKTNKGEIVRSKSEKIIADLLYSLNIEYKYECPLTLKSGKTVYPDFTLLSPITKSEVYYEHLGMMDVPEYAIKNIKKIEMYNLSEIKLGKNLIVSFETTDKILNTDVLINCLKEYFYI